MKFKEFINEGFDAKLRTALADLQNGIINAGVMIDAFKKLKLEKGQKSLLTKLDKAISDADGYAATFAISFLSSEE